MCTNNRNPMSDNYLEKKFEEYAAAKAGRRAPHPLTQETGQQWMESATGVGEHNAFIREHICAALAFLGIALDADANTRNAATLSSAHRQVVVAVEPTNEEWIAASHALSCLASGKAR